MIWDKIKNLLGFRVRPKFKQYEYRGELYTLCGNYLIDRGFEQKGKYCFQHRDENGLIRLFFLYKFHKEGVTLNIYYPQESTRLIRSLDELKVQVDRFI